METAIQLGDRMQARALKGPLTWQPPRPGAIVGEVASRSPERTRGRTERERRSELDSLGATGDALWTGCPPCDGSTPGGRRAAPRQVPPEPPTRYQLAIPAAFEGVVLRLLAKRPDDRYPSATLLLRELERVGRFLGVTV